MAEFDLTSRMSPYLDRHLVFPLLEFLPEKGLYDEKVSRLDCYGSNILASLPLPVSTTNIVAVTII